MITDEINKAFERKTQSAEYDERYKQTYAELNLQAVLRKLDEQTVTEIEDLVSIIRYESEKEAFMDGYISHYQKAVLEQADKRQAQVLRYRG